MKYFREVHPQISEDNNSVALYLNPMFLKAAMIENFPSFFVFLETLAAQDNQAFTRWDRTHPCPAPVTQVRPSPSFLITPMRSADEAVGYLLLENPRSPSCFGISLMNGHFFFSYCNCLNKRVSLNIQNIGFHSFCAMIGMVHIGPHPPASAYSIQVLHPFLTSHRGLVASPAADPAFHAWVAR